MEVFQFKEVYYRNWFSVLLLLGHTMSCLDHSLHNVIELKEEVMAKGEINLQVQKQMLLLHK